MFKDRQLEKLWTDFDEILRICAPLAEVCALRVLLLQMEHDAMVEMKQNWLTHHINHSRNASVC